MNKIFQLTMVCPCVAGVRVGVLKQRDDGTSWEISDEIYYSWTRNRSVTHCLNYYLWDQLYAYRTNTSMYSNNTCLYLWSYSELQKFLHQTGITLPYPNLCFAGLTIACALLYISEYGTPELRGIHWLQNCSYSMLFCKFDINLDCFSRLTSPASPLSSPLLSQDPKPPL